MGSITIHSIDGELKRRLDEEARKKNISKNRFIKELLSRELGVAFEGSYSDDYGEFCGVWSVEEHAVFEKSQSGNSEVDPEEWSL